MPSHYQIAFVVMPAGHGKSSLHNRESYLYDAETVFPGRSTLDLEYLYLKGQNSGFWLPYYKLWSKHLADALKNETGRIVVMIPDSEIGLHAGWTDLGGLILAHAAWVSNFKARLDTSADHSAEWALESLRGGTICQNNAELVNKLLVKAMIWANTDF